MRETHRTLDRGQSWLQAHLGLGLVCLAVLWTALTPRLAWSQSAVWQPQGAATGNIYYNGGNVGIGTTSPAAKFHVNGLGGVASAAWNIHTALRLGDNGQISHSAVVFDTGAAGLTAFRGFWVGKFNQDFHLARFDSSGAAHPAVDMSVLSNGNVGIGTTNPTYRLTVEGAIGTRDVIVTNAPWSDYVFRPDYRLRPLSEVNAFIQQHRHLPDIPSEAEVKEKGVSVGEMQAKLLAKIEELTLHMIQAEQQNQELRERIARLEKGAAAGVKPAGR